MDFSKDEWFVVLDTLNSIAKEYSRKKAEIRSVVRNTDTERILVDIPISWHFSDTGRRPGTPPPFQVILEWVRYRNIGGTSIAWAITKAIGRDGVKGKHWLDAAIEETSDVLEVLTGNKIDKFGKDLFITWDI